MKSTILKVFSAALVLALGACGGGSNNDQGAAFALVSFNSQLNGICQSAGVTSVLVPLSEGNGVENGLSGVFAPCATVQNNLSGQFIRTDRVALSYYVEGATEQPPETAVPFGVVVGSQRNQLPPFSSTPITTTLPVNAGNSGSAGGTATATTSVIAGMEVVPAEIQRWMSLNRTKLPEPPFNMWVTAQVSGITSAGDQIWSNPLNILAVVSQDTLINPDATGTPGGATDSASGEEIIDEDLLGEDSTDDGVGAEASPTATPTVTVTPTVTATATAIVTATATAG